MADRTADHFIERMKTGVRRLVKAQIPAVGGGDDKFTQIGESFIEGCRQAVRFVEADFVLFETLQQQVFAVESEVHRVGAQPVGIRIARVRELVLAQTAPVRQRQFLFRRRRCSAQQAEQCMRVGAGRCELPLTTTDQCGKTVEAESGSWTAKRCRRPQQAGNEKLDLHCGRGEKSAGSLAWQEGRLLLVWSSGRAWGFLVVPGHGPEPTKNRQARLS